MTETTTIPSRIAALADDSHLVHGVAISAGEVTRGLNGRKKWPAAALRASAASLEGTPVNPLHSESQVGTVRRAAWDEQRNAVVYELELTDAKLADQVRAGGLEVSIEARHGRDGETDDGAMLVSDIKFTGIALVQHGASATSSAEHGPAPEQAFAAALSAGEIQATLAGHGGSGGMDVPDEYRFDNPGEAVEAAQELGFDGAGDNVIHTHDEGDETVFMPAPTHEELLEALNERAEATASLLADAPYEVTNVAPGDVDEWTDAEWDGDAAIAAAPNPSDVDDAAETLDSMMALVPADDDARDAKANWGGPFRAEPGGAVNTRALVAIDGALSGARNGFSSLADDTREAATEWIQAMLDVAPDELFGAGDAEAADALSEGAWVTFRADGEQHLGRVAYSDEERSLVKRYDEERGELTDESIAKATAHIHATDPPEEAGTAHHLEADAAADIEAGDIVTWNSQGDRPAAGRVIETITEGRYDTELSGDATVNAPAALIRLYRPSGDEDDEWASTQTTVAHRTDSDTLSARETWPDLARIQAAHLVDINGTEIDLTPPDYVVDAAQAALDAKAEYDSLTDCGTGVGESRAQAIVNADLAPSDFTGGENTAIPDYLTSHADDVADLDTHPRGWDEETWTDGCGPVQFALWGGTTDGRAREWFDETEQRLQAAMDAANDEAEAAAATGGQALDEAAESATRQTDTNTTTLTSDMTDPEDPEENVTELKARLSDKTERIDDLEAELAEVKDERDDYESKAAAVEEAEAAFAAALADHVPRDAEALQADLGLSQMREWLDDIDGASVGDAATSDPDPAVQTGGGGGGKTANLSAAERDEKDRLEARLAEMEAKDNPLAEKEAERIESQLAELTEA